MRYMICGIRSENLLLRAGAGAMGVQRRNPRFAFRNIDRLLEKKTKVGASPPGVRIAPPPLMTFNVNRRHWMISSVDSSPLPPFIRFVFIGLVTLVTAMLC